MGIKPLCCVENAGMWVTVDKWDDCKCDCHEQNCCTCSACENYHYLMTVKRQVEVNKK